MIGDKATITIEEAPDGIRMHFEGDMGKGVTLVAQRMYDLIRADIDRFDIPYDHADSRDEEPK